MGVLKPASQIPFWIPFLIIIIIIITPSLADNHDSRTTNNNSLSPPPFIQDKANANVSPFKPSMAVVVGVLTTMFSITFLLLLYAKHCKRENSVVGVRYSTNHSALINPSSTNRKNSGIDRAVIESLPIFRFGALRGQKDGLECAVCLTKFEPTEVLRLLPKCNHAFHVECVDTWLDSHSTCPLCRYRVDPEDILLSFEKNIDSSESEAAPPEFRRVSGRHSSAGEFGSRSQNPTSFRRSVDGAFLKKREEGESVAVGCFDRPRKDGWLLTDGLVADRKSFERRFEHRIIISAGANGDGFGFNHRWSDVQPSDLLYLRSEMLLIDSRRFSSGSSRPSVERRQQQQQQQQMLVPLALQQHTSSSSSSSAGIDDGGNGNANANGSGVINSRSVSEITGLSRFSNRGEGNCSIIIMSNRNNHRQRHAGLVSRWLAWVSSRSQSQSLPHVRSDRTTTDIV